MVADSLSFYLLESWLCVSCGLYILALSPSLDFIELTEGCMCMAGFMILFNHQNTTLNIYMHLADFSCHLRVLSIVPGLKYAGSRNGDAQELLYSYSVHFLNEVHRCLFNLNSHMVFW